MDFKLNQPVYIFFKDFHSINKKNYETRSNRQKVAFTLDPFICHRKYSFLSNWEKNKIAILNEIENRFNEQWSLQLVSKGDR